MKILNCGSLNIDHVYKVDHFVRPGETLASFSYSRFSGGKGLNQSIALAKAGAEVFHSGKIGEDGAFLRKKLEDCGVDVSLVKKSGLPTGHAVIQVCRTGENSIILYGGANRAFTDDDASEAVSRFSRGDFILLQNEMSAIPELMKAASLRGMKIVLNTAPLDEALRKYPLELVDYLILNEIEGEGLTGEKTQEKILRSLKHLYPKSAAVLTCGADGARYLSEKMNVIHVPSRKVEAVDTTAAGDTFIGFFLAALANGARLLDAVKMGCAAAALCVTRPGAANSIPTLAEVKEFQEAKR